MSANPKTWDVTLSHPDTGDQHTERVLALDRREAISHAKAGLDALVAWNVVSIHWVIDLEAINAEPFPEPEPAPALAPAPAIDVQYHEVSLDEVLRYFVSGYVLEEGTVVGHDAFVDMSKRAVIFRLNVKKVPKE